MKTLSKEYKKLAKLRQKVGMRRINLHTENLLYPSESKENELKELEEKFNEIDQRLKEIIEKISTLFKKHTKFNKHRTS